MTIIELSQGERTFELVNFDWKYRYHIVHLNRQSGALVIPRNTYHRSISGENGSIVINQAKRYDGFDHQKSLYQGLVPLIQIYMLYC